MSGSRHTPPRAGLRRPTSSTQRRRRFLGLQRWTGEGSRTLPRKRGRAMPARFVVRAVRVPAVRQALGCMLNVHHSFKISKDMVDTLPNLSLIIGGKHGLPDDLGETGNA